MKNIYIIAKYTFKEALSKKVFITFFGISTFVILLFLGIFLSVDSISFWQSIKGNTNGGNMILTELVKGLKFLIINPLYGGGLFLAIFSASGFIPSMLQRGNVEMILSKPVSRGQLLIGRFTGVTFMVLVNLIYAIGSFYLLFGFKFGEWDAGFLITILTITLAFIVLYSLMILIGVLTKSSLTAMMLSYIIFFVFSPILYGRGMMNSMTDSFWKVLGDILYYIIPRTAGIGELTTLIAGGGTISDYSAIIHSVIYTILTLSLAIFIFNKKDY